MHVIVLVLWIASQHPEYEKWVSDLLRALYRQAGRVSEQFLNGISKHYRLFSATNGGQQENKYVRTKSDIH